MESFVFEQQVLFRVGICSVTWGSMGQGEGRGQKLVLYENSKKSSSGSGGDTCLSGHLFELCNTLAKGIRFDFMPHKMETM